MDLRSLYVLASELLGDNFEHLLGLVKEFIVIVWEMCKQKLYGSVSAIGWRSGAGCWSCGQGW